VFCSISFQFWKELERHAILCDPPAFLQAGDPAYVDAMELAQTLRSRGFTSKCVLRSTMEGAFEGMEGAALYRTDRGDFEALFLAKPQTFVGLIVMEEQRNGIHTRSTVHHRRGPPIAWKARARFTSSGMRTSSWLYAMIDSG
jgi:hypothetical protein